MTEPERARAIEAVQLQLFELRARVKEIERERVRLRRLKVKLAFQGTKICRKCREDMDAEQFYRDDSRRDGLSSYCRECKLKTIRARKLAA